MLYKLKINKGINSLFYLIKERVFVLFKRGEEMGNINIDFYNSGNTIILGYTNEHLATNLNFVVPAVFRDGYSYILIFNLENNQEYMELFASYPITYKVSNIIMSAGTSGHLQLSVLKKQDNGEVMVAQSGIIPFKVLSSLADNNTEIGEYTNTIETLIAEFVSNLQNINSRELKANKIVFLLGYRAKGFINKFFLQKC